MKRSQDIEVVRLSMELASMQSRVAFLEELLDNSVSRDQYDAVCAERDAAVRESEAKDSLHEDEIAGLKACFEQEKAEILSAQAKEMER